MNRQWILVALALLCAAQVWSKPTDKPEVDEEQFPGDDPDNDTPEEEDNSGPKRKVQMLTEPQVFHVLPGATVTMPCQFQDLDNVLADIAVNWKRNDELLYIDGIKMSTDPRITRLINFSLEIRDINHNDTLSQYRCEAADANDEKDFTHVEHQIQLSYPDRSDSIRPLPAKVNELELGEDITLGCQLTDPKIQPKKMYWSRKGVRLADHRIEGNSIYIDIRNANRHLAGDYQCVYETGLSDPLVQHVKLRVKHLEIEDNGTTKDVYAVLGRMANLSCVAHAHPPVREFHWYFNGNQIRMSSHDAQSSSQDGHHVHLLTIANASLDDLGTYQCAAKSDLGVKRGPLIELHELPGKPTFKSGEVVNGDIQFQWKVVSYKPLVELELWRRKHGDKKWIRVDEVKVESDMGSEHIVQASISGIEPGKHELKLRVRNDEENTEDKHWGPYSNIHDFDGEYPSAESTVDGGAALTTTINFVALLIAFVPLAHSFL